MSSLFVLVYPTKEDCAILVYNIFGATRGVPGAEEQPGAEPQGHTGVGACGRGAVRDPEAAGDSAETVAPTPGGGAGLLQQAEGRHLSQVHQVVRIMTACRRCPPVSGTPGGQGYDHMQKVPICLRYTRLDYDKLKVSTCLRYTRLDYDKLMGSTCLRYTRWSGWIMTTSRICLSVSGTPD